MDNEGKITHGQAAFLSYASAAGNIVFTFTFATSIIGRAFWVAVLIGALMNIPFALWILYLGKSQQGGTIFDILETGLGKVVCKIIIVMYLLLNIAIAVCMLNMFSGMIKLYFLQFTPTFAIMLFIVLICTIFANSGIQNFARLVEILGLLFTVNYFFGFFLSFFKTFKMEYVVPVFDTSSIQFAKGIMISAGTCGESLMFLMLMVGSISHTKKHYWSVIKGLVSWSLVLAFAILIMEGDIGQELLSAIAQAGVPVARVIQIGDFVRGLEILVLLTYQYIIIEKTIMYIYSSYESLKKLFHVKKSIWLLILSALSIFAASVFVNSYNTGYFFSVFLGSYVILPFVTLVLMLASFSVMIKKKKNGGQLK